MTSTTVSKTKPPYACASCGKLTPSPRGNRTPRFCSHQCAHQHKRTGASSPLTLIACPTCRTAIVSRSGRMYCSTKCRDVAYYRRERPAPSCDTPCQSCGTRFTTHKNNRDYCDACQLTADRRHHQRRRALQRNATIETFDSTEIFERDRWTCQLCNTRVQRDAVVPHPKAPTLDHVIPLSKGGDPLSKGGDHARANVQCAHFLCNSTKGDRVNGTGEQLRLVG